MCCWCCSCCEDFCDDYCSCCPDIPDYDDMKEYLREWRQDYQILFTTILSRCPEACNCVSQRNTYVMLGIVCTLEMGVFCLMSFVLHTIIHLPDFNFGNDWAAIDWDSDNCTYPKSILKDTHDWSNLLLPLHATLLSFGALFGCCLYKPPFGPIIGAFFRYPFLITVMVYSWLLYDAFASLSTENCLSETMDATMVVELESRFSDLKDWTLRLSVCYTVMMATIYPTLSCLYLSCYHSLRACNRSMDWCFRYYLHCVTRFCGCSDMCYRIMTSCLCGERRALLGANRRANRSQNRTADMTEAQRKKLVQKTEGECPLCMEENTTLILTRGCNHGCCVECMQAYIKADLKNLSAYPRQCWSVGCHTLISYTQAEYCVRPDDLAQYDLMLVKASVNNTDTMSCPKCEAVMVKPRDRGGLLQCVNVECRADLCSNCDALWHTDQSCTEYQQQLTQKTATADDAFEEMVKKEKWRHCPRCGLVVERTEGCYHMTHLNCTEGGSGHRTDFCYLCGEVLMKMEGEGWRYSAQTQTKHFNDGVYSPCVKADSNPLQSTSLLDNDNDNDAGNDPNARLEALL